VNLAGVEHGITRVFSYDVPVLYIWDVFEGPQAGGLRISIAGTNFPSDTSLGGSGVMIDGNDCPMLEFISSSSIVIESPPGVAQPSGNFVSIGAPGTPLSELIPLHAWTYDSPMLSGINPTKVLGLNGGSTLTVIGKFWRAGQQPDSLHWP